MTKKYSHYQGYGMTESGTVAKSLAFAKNPFKTKSGACGTVIRNAEMKVVDTITGISLPRNKSGEICVRGHQLMKGKAVTCSGYVTWFYWKNTLMGKKLCKFVRLFE